MGLFDLLKPKWKNSDDTIRLGAVKELTDERKLTSVVQKDSNVQIRIAAIATLGSLADGHDFGPSEDLAVWLADPDPKIRAEAARACSKFMSARALWNDAGLKAGIDSLLENKQNDLGVGDVINFSANLNIEYTLIYSKIEDMLIQMLQSDNDPDARSAADSAVKLIRTATKDNDEIAKKLTKAGIDPVKQLQ